MALGGNLKKKSLLPSGEEKEQDKPKATSESKAPTKKQTPKNTKAKKDTKSVSKATAKTKAQPSKKKSPTKKKVVGEKQVEAKPKSEKPEVEEAIKEQPVVEEQPVEEQSHAAEEPSPVAHEPLVEEESVGEFPVVIESQEVEESNHPVVENLQTLQAEELHSSVKTQIRVETQIIEKPVVRAGLVTKAEYERRQKLHDKFAAEIKALDGKRVHLIVFRIEQEEFAIEISKVSEVVVTPTITRMPQAPRYVPGIATIRGRGVVTLDLAYKLGYVDDSQNLAERSAYTIVIKTERFTVGVLVPEVPVSQIIEGEKIQTADDNVSETSLDETYIKGLIRTEGRMIFYIDIDEMIEGDRLKSRLVEE